MLPDRVSNPGPLTYESGALPIARVGKFRDCVLCVHACNVWACFIYFATNTQVILVLTTIIEAGSMGGPFGDLHLYPLLAASLEIYSIYVKNETANKKKKKKEN